MGGYGYSAVTFPMAGHSVLRLVGKGRFRAFGANADPMEKLIVVGSIGSLIEGTGPRHRGEWLGRTEVLDSTA